MIEQDLGSVEYVSNQFGKFYSTGAQCVDAPPEIKHREFGFLSFRGRTMFRHIGFEVIEELRGYLRNYSPAHSYFSAAYYNKPRASMVEKGWIGADLIFDIDADHFVLSCQKIHDRWTCKACGEAGKGHPPERCPGCGKATYFLENWICGNCLDAAKYEAQKLIDMLIQDFGFQPSELSVNFSGNRGYHVHVRSPVAKELDQLARREVVDYILGIGIEAQYQGLTPRHAGGGSMLERGGWRGRTIRALYDFIGKSTPDEIKALRLSRNTTRDLVVEKDKILSSLMNQHPSRIVRYIDKKSMGNLLNIAVEEQASAIDTVVTTDLKRLIRLPNTLHGKTGWLTQNVTIEDLPDYDPLTTAVAFQEGHKKIYIKHAPEISLQGESYGPFKEETQELPMAVAMFFLCRKSARVVN